MVDFIESLPARAAAAIGASQRAVADAVLSLPLGGQSFPAAEAAPPPRRAAAELTRRERQALAEKARIALEGASPDVRPSTYSREEFELDRRLRRSRGRLR